MKSFALHSGIVLAAVGLLGCATPQFVYDILPAVYEYKVDLAPGATVGEHPAYTANEDGSITFDKDGLRVTVSYLRDGELNELYSDVSFQERFSANPFTYGNWRDPDLGYTPSRFTVFEVEVFNPVLPKVELFPDQVQLLTDRGEDLPYYGINREESAFSFEDYYTLIRGPGGNEQYRFDQRMSIVREELYREEHQVFKGGDYSGYIAFSALDEEVVNVELRVKGFALQFDEANHPTETVDLVFAFDRKVKKRELKGEEARLARQRIWVLRQAQ